MSNAMRNLKIDKVTINFGAGKDQHRLDKGAQLIEMITGMQPLKTTTQKRIPGWGLRPGLPVGLKLTLRGEKAAEVLSRMLVAKENRLNASCFDNNGNVSFGVPEYIDIPGAKYDPKIGIMGMQVSVTLKRPGYRVAKRKLRTARIGHSHKITKEDALAFMQEHFKVEVAQ